jgi:hypothetical protein
MQKNTFNQPSFQEIFPYYKDDDLFPPTKLVLDGGKSYNIFCISPFDHILTNEEAIEYVVEYKGLNEIQKNNSLDVFWNLYKKYEGKYLKLYNLFFKDYTVLSYVYFSDTEPQKISNQNALHKIAIGNIQDSYLTRLLVPQLGVILDPKHDNMHFVHASKEHYKKDEFEAIVKEAGLYILR